MKDCAHVPELGGQHESAGAKARHSIDELQEWLHYDRETGVVTWKKSPACRTSIGGLVGGPNSKGYLTFEFKGGRYTVHRVAFALAHNRWPLPTCDHINGIKTDNRIVNRREATLSENGSNRRIQRNNRSGFKGVYWNKRDGKWQAQVIARKKRHTKLFCCIEDAAAWAKQLREQLHGGFVRH